MNRLLQVCALTLSIGLLAFVACRAQSSPAPVPPANTAAGTPTDAGLDAEPAPPPEVYLPASKSGGMFLEHQQAPR